MIDLLCHNELNVTSTTCTSRKRMIPIKKNLMYSLKLSILNKWFKKFPKIKRIIINISASIKRIRTPYLNNILTFEYSFFA